MIDASNLNITNLIQATTNITYGDGYTNIPFLYIRYNLLMFDEALLTLNIQDSQITTNKTNITNLLQKTTNLTYGNGYTNIPFLYINNNLVLYDSVKQGNTDVLSTLNTNTTEITSIKTRTSGITVDGSGQMSIVNLLVSNQLKLQTQPEDPKIAIIYTLTSQQEQITNNTNSISAINTKLNNTVSNSSLSTTFCIGLSNL